MMKVRVTGEARKPELDSDRFLICPVLPYPGYFQPFFGPPAEKISLFFQ